MPGVSRCIGTLGRKREPRGARQGECGSAQSADELLDYQAGVLTAESEAVGHGNVDIHFPRNIRNVVEVAVGVWLFLVDRRVEDSIVDATNAHDSFQRA